MSPQKKQTGGARAQASESVRPKPKIRVVGSEATKGSGDRPKPTFRVVESKTNLPPGSGKVIVTGEHVATEDGYVLTTKELRNRFSQNLDRLLGIVGLSRKDAAEAIGIPYQFLRRIVSAGVSRPDERSRVVMAKLARYFSLPSFDVFWDFDLLKRILTSDEGKPFLEKFRPRLIAERERRLSEVKNARENELALLSHALGFKVDQKTTFNGPYADKVVAILDSPKAELFKRIIDDYHALISQSNDGEGGEQRQAVG